MIQFGLTDNQLHKIRNVYRERLLHFNFKDVFQENNNVCLVLEGESSDSWLGKIYLKTLEINDDIGVPHYPVELIEYDLLSVYYSAWIANNPHKKLQYIEMVLNYFDGLRVDAPLIGKIIKENDKDNKLLLPNGDIITCRVRGSETLKIKSQQNVGKIVCARGYLNKHEGHIIDFDVIHLFPITNAIEAVNMIREMSAKLGNECDKNLANTLTALSNVINAAYAVLE